MVKKMFGKGNGSKTKASAPAKKPMCCAGKTSAKPQKISQEQLDEMIRMRAYYIWEKSGKQGDSFAQWSQAKQEICKELKIIA